MSLFVKEAYYASLDPPPELLDWRITAQQMRLELEHGRPAILEMSAFLRAQGLHCPGRLAHFTAEDIQPLVELAPDARVLRTVGAALRADSSQSAVPGQIIPSRAVLTNDALVKAIQAHSAQFQRSGQLTMRTKRKLRLPRHFGNLGPAQRIKIARPDSLPPRILDRYVFGAKSANIPKHVRGAIP